VYPSKDQLADWLDMYAKLMEIDFQGETEVVRAAYKDADNQWEVEMRQKGKTVTLHPKHLVLATGNSSIPNLPHLSGADSFKGHIVHSSRFSGCSGGQDWQGKRCVIVGSNTSAHDIAQNLWENGADVTMVQRSATCTLKTQHIRDLCAVGGYSEEGLAGCGSEELDLKSESVPYALRLESLRSMVNSIKEEDSDYYNQLQKRGWAQDWGEDGTGPYMMFIRRFCVYDFDIGASQLLIDGKVRLARGEVAQIRPASVVLSSGDEMPCDFIVLATGYKNMSEYVSRLISPEAAKAVGPVWGLGSGFRSDPGPYDGELRNMWRPTAQRGLWFQGGNLKLSRFHSLHLALQLKARYAQLPIRVFSQEECDTATQKMGGS